MTRGAYVVAWGSIAYGAYKFVTGLSGLSRYGDASEEAVCRYFEIELELDGEEKWTGRFTCLECRRAVDLTAQRFNR